MGLAITWRNPLPVQTIQRCSKVADNDVCGSVYIVEELIGGSQAGQWVELSTLEVQRGGHRAALGSRLAAANKHKSAEAS